MALSLDEYLVDHIYFDTGADLRLAELGQDTETSSAGTVSDLSGQLTADQTGQEAGPRFLFLPVGEHLKVPGVVAAARVGDYSATSSIGGRQRSGRLLGIDRLDFPAVAFFRPDFAGGESLGSLMNRLGSASNYVLVSRSFLATNNLSIGEPLRLTVSTAGDFTTLSLVVAGAFDLFPTHYPQDGPLFVGNLDYVHQGLGGTYPYDVWLATSAVPPGEEIVAGVRRLDITVVTAQDAHQRIREAQIRPERQGLFGLLSVGFLAAAVLTVLGFLLYAAISFQQRFVELGMLRAIGLSTGQMAAYLAGEQAVLIGAGMGSGTAVGVVAGRLFIPFLQVGDEQVPPFLVQIAWDQIFTIYALFGVMFLAAVAMLTLLLGRMRVFEAIKLGEAT
jgi:putative ABC transport system permease protein